jgi:hypothetical protein
MRWLKHICKPFVEYLPLLADILFRPWRFTRGVVQGTAEYTDNLRRCSFFLASIYLILQPYLLPQKMASSQKGFTGAFQKEIVLLVMIAAFSAAFPLIERKNKQVTLDTFLNLIIPLMVVSIFIDTGISNLAQLYLQRLGLSLSDIYVTCRGLFKYRCLSEVLPAGHTNFYFTALAYSVIEGHLKALIVLCYFVGLEPLRTRKYLPVMSKAGTLAFVFVMYLMFQALNLYSNDLF